MASNHNTNKEAIIIADSMVNNLWEAEKADIVSISGCSIQNLRIKLHREFIRIGHYKVIALLVGTCNVTPKEVWLHYKKERERGINHENITLIDHTRIQIDFFITLYKALLAEVTSLNPKAHILVCSVLPRLFDDSVNGNHLYEINKALNTLATGHPKTTFLRIFKSYIKLKVPIERYYCRDGLHLSEEGIKLLHDILTHEIAKKLKV